MSRAQVRSRISGRHSRTVVDSPDGNTLGNGVQFTNFRRQCGILMRPRRSIRTSSPSPIRNVLKSCNSRFVGSLSIAAYVYHSWGAQRTGQCSLSSMKLVIHTESAPRSRQEGEKSHTRETVRLDYTPTGRQDSARELLAAISSMIRHRATRCRTEFEYGGQETLDV